MGVRTAHKSGVQHARQNDIGAELAASFQETRVFEPRKSGADAEFASRAHGLTLSPKYSTAA